MKNECDIVKDLLFSYNDGVLSKTSIEFVENHIKTCRDCNNVLEEIKSELKEKDDKKDIDIFKSIKRKMSKKNILIFISLIILLILCCLDSEQFENQYGPSPKYIDDTNLNQEQL